ncbi:MAG TPA: cytochrome c [Methylomirabilota bacterium]|nr:cytochrome c [Methylomirabilota bacterium]
MKDVKDNSPEAIEPTVQNGSVYLPMWMIGLLGLLIYWGFNYIDAHGGGYNELVYEPYRSTNQLASFLPTDESAAQIKLGAQVYKQFCEACHQPNGSGNAVQAPPLAGSEWVLAEGPNRLIRIPIAGLFGPIKAAGKEMNANMPPLAVAGAMSDEQLAAVLTYIRNAWGNTAPPVTVEHVQRVRADLKGRTDQYSVEEIEKLPLEVP